MGKKKGAAIRARKRADEAAAELLDQTIENQEIAKYEAKEDSELFVLDSNPDASFQITSRNKEKKRASSTSSSSFSTTLNIKQGKKNRISEKDEKQIKKILEAHSKEKVISMASAQEKRLKQRKRTKRIAGNAKASFDLWGEESGAGTKKRKTITAAAAATAAKTKVIPVKSGIAAAGGTAPIEFKTVTKKSLRKDIQQPAKFSNKQLKMREVLKERARKSVQVELAQPGQSYRPDEEQHQDAIGEALSIELRRKEATEYEDAPIGGGKMSDETMALLVHSSDEESSDSDDDDSDNDYDETKSASVTAVKRKGKLTRAERNKQKRVKALKVSLDEKKRVKQLLNSLQDAKRISKEIRRKEAERVARKEEIDALKEDQKLKPLGVNVVEKISELDPIHAPSLPVALTEELKDGSLRTVKPKGSLLTDRMESMISRKLANRKALSKKRVVHGKRRMKGGKGREFLLA